MMRYFYFLILFVPVANAQNLNAVGADTAATSNYYEQRERGWYWYEKTPLPNDSKQPIVDQSTVVVVPPLKELTPRELLKKQGEDWENQLAVTILNPTQENYKEYMASTAKIFQQTHDFASGFKRALWVNPEYDYTLQHPVTTQAIVAKNQSDQANTEKRLHELATQNGIIFFFRSDCPYCHRFAPILEKFSALYGFSVIPVSLDGKGLPEYPYPKRNLDLGRKLNVNVVPAVFLVNPESNSVATIGYGFNDWSMLTTKLLEAAKQMPATTTVSYQGDSSAQ